MIQPDNILRKRAIDEVNKHQNSVHQDPYRLHYHLMPPIGLLNDPNGFVYFKGKYHLFYQWNPFATEHGPKFWGHYSSTDLVHWDEEPIALTPSDWYDKNGCYSGSAVIFEDKMYLFYTGNVKDENNQRETYQCMAISEDGIHFEKKGPVIYLPDGYTAHFRDPKVWQEGDTWFMVIGAQTDDEEGAVVLFTSTDLESWEHQGILTGSNQNELGYFGYMWECPDLFSLSNKDVLLFSPQGLEAEGIKYNNLYQTGYFVGEFDRDDFTYNHGEFDEFDRGFEFYAPQTTIGPDERRILFGWMGLPNESEPFHPTRNHHWIHAMTIPRELKLVDNKLYQYPVEELKKLRGQQTSHKGIVIENDSMRIDGLDGRSLELIVDIVSNESDTFTINYGQGTSITFDATTNLLSFNRTGLNNGEIESRYYKVQQLNQLHLFIDTSSIELFVNGGETAFTSRVFEAPAENQITFGASGKITVDVQKWELNKLFK